VAVYLGHEPWFVQLPNARDITVRMLMNHTSEVMRYELQEEFLRDLTASPRRSWTVAERVAYVLGDTARFAAGKGWDYSDTNYILVGAIVERITGRPLNEEIRRRVLRPLGLRNTVPTEAPVVPGVAQGYAGPENPFGGSDAMLVGGEFVVNPQFEWAGGGYASTAEELARWAKALYEGKAFDPSLLPEMLAGVAAPMLGAGARYGLGVIVRDTPLGASWGHSGFFPGYVTEMRYYPERRFAVAFQVNTSVGRALGRSPGAVAQELAAIVASWLGR
jgi:D-alanyl-D-alanine carboxypeptidase